MSSDLSGADTTVSAVSAATLDTALDSTNPKPLPAEHIGSSPARSQPHTPSSSTQSASLNSNSPSRVRPAGKLSSPVRLNPSSAHKHSNSTLDARRQALDQLQQSTTPEVPEKEPDFLTSLAAQERKVLEIKEELHKAEEELDRLKKQWMSQEASGRSLDAARPLHPLRPMTGSSPSRPDTDDTDGSSAWMYEEMQRRKALMNRGKGPSRRVFNGSRNPRPLSLAPQAPTRHFSATTLGDLTESRRSLDDRPPERGRGSPTSFFRSPSSSPRRQSMYLSTGKQLANEWREGLWTFFEDLKHATVGEESRLPASSPGTGHRKRNSMFTQNHPSISNKPPNAPRHHQRKSDTKPQHNKHFSHVGGMIDGGGALWEESVLDEVEEFPTPPTVKPTPIRPKPKQAPSTINTQPINHESWDSWDSPDNKQPSSAHSSNLSHSRNTSPSPPASTPASSTTHSTEATPRQSTGPIKSKDAIPWPALAKISPGHLRRTASTLMDEWEKSLTAESEKANKSSDGQSRQRDFDSSPSPIEHITLGG